MITDPRVGTDFCKPCHFLPLSSHHKKPMATAIPIAMKLHDVDDPGISCGAVDDGCKSDNFFGADDCSPGF